MDRYTKLMEVYTLEELLESMELEPSEALLVLEEAGYKINLEEPL